MNYRETLKTIIDGLRQFQGFFADDYYLDFEDRAQRLEDRIAASQQEGRLLKIGIVGEVKAGKSSFLNALIFDGKDVLPKASTPMTAALTKISHAITPKAKIIFYTAKDWERVQECADEYDRIFNREYGIYIEQCLQNKRKPRTREEVRFVIEKSIPLKYRACNELTEMAGKNSIDVSAVLGESREIQGEQVHTQLADFIGAKGKFTPVVKHVELQMNNTMLEGIEIVDTPGLNDPIISRGEATKRFLGDCDVVFLLSYCGQFLTHEDIRFMSETLPNEGIRNVVIVGSKFDSGVRDDNKHKRLYDALNSSKKIYDAQARENISKCMVGGTSIQTLERIRSSLPPSYVSSILYSCALKVKNKVSLNEDERVVIDGLKRFEGFSPDYSTLLSLSGINQIKKDKLKGIIQNKQKVIAERNREMLQDNKAALLRIVDSIHNQALNNMDDLQHYDKGQLEKKLEMLQHKLNSIRHQIRGIFENSAVDAKRILNRIAVDIDGEIENYVDFKVSEHHDEQVSTYNTGFLGLRKETRVTTITTYTASVSDVIQNMRNYIVRCKKMANEEFQKIVNIREIENRVKDTVIGAFDMSGRDFNESEILLPLEIVLKKITIPEINIEVSQFETMIVEAFSGATVKGDQIHQLRLVESSVLDQIAQTIKKELNGCLLSIQNIMAEQASLFIDNILLQLSKNLEMLKKQIDDKENSISKYKILCDTIATYKKMISGMEL